MTKNQRLVLRWLKERCSASGVVRCSSAEIAEDIDLSQSQALRILWALEESGHLETLQKGKGRGPSKYRVLSHSYASGRTRSNQIGTSQQVHSDASKKFFPFRLFSTPRNNIGENAHPNTHKARLFENAERPVQQVKTSNSPFKRFRRHWDNPAKWTGPDFVCYYSFVHKVRFGDLPAISWRIECGAARILMKRLGSKEELKAFIQVAFGMCKRKPIGLHSFASNYFYEQVVSTDEDYIQGYLDEYQDEEVFPWLRQIVTDRSHELAVEYQKNLVMRGLGLYK